MKREIYGILLEILSEMEKDLSIISLESIVGLYDDSNFDFSSIEKINFIVKIEEIFNIEFNMADQTLVTINDYVDYIQKLKFTN